MNKEITKPILLGASITFMLLAATTLYMKTSPAQANATAVAVKGTERAALAVETVLPAKETWPVSLKASGALAAWDEIILGVELGGLRIVSLNVDVGDRVEKGQLIAKLNDETLRADVLKAQAALMQARASLREAQANANRSRSVQDTGAISGQQIEQYEVALQLAQAGVKAAEAGLAAQKIRFEQSRIVAPSAGLISSRTASMGEVVANGGELVRIVRDERIEWRAELDAGQLSRVRIGMPARITLASGKTIEGEVRQVSPTLDQKTRTAYAYVALPVHEDARAGDYVSGQFEIGEMTALTVPGSAVVLRDGKSHIFVLDEANGKVRQKTVLTGRSREDRIEIVDGLAEGDQVVRAGGAFLNDGDTVSVQNTGAKS